MCEPISGLTMAQSMVVYAAAASAAASYASTSAAADAQEAAINNNMAVAQQGADLQTAQINAQSSQQTSQRALEAQREQSRLRVMAGESGAMGGVSEMRIMNENQANLGSDMATLETNRKNQIEQVQQEARAGRSSGAAQLSSIKQASLIGTGLQIAGSATSAYAQTEYANKVAGKTTTNRGGS